MLFNDGLMGRADVQLIVWRPCKPPCYATMGLWAAYIYPFSPNQHLALRQGVLERGFHSVAAQAEFESTV